MNGAKFSYYELIGYLMPGAIVVLPIYYWASTSFSSFASQIDDNVMTATAFLVVSFVIGHFVQAVSSGPLERFFLFLAGGHPNNVISSIGIKNMKPDQWISSKRRIVLNYKGSNDEEVIKTTSDKEAIRIAIILSRGKGKTEVFNALYAFNRGLSTALMLLLLLLIIYTVTHLEYILIETISCLVCILLLVVQLLRLRKRSEYFLEETIRQAEASLN